MCIVVLNRSIRKVTAIIMKEDLSAVIRRIGVLLEGNIRRALENSIANG